MGSTRPVHPENTPLPILVTLSGIVTVVSPSQFLKAELLISVTLLPKVMELRVLQLAKAFSPI